MGVVDINGRPEVEDLMQEIPMEMADISGRPEVEGLMQEIVMEMADISGRLEVEDLIQEIAMEEAITFSNVSKRSRVLFWRGWGVGNEISWYAMC